MTKPFARFSSALSLIGMALPMTQAETITQTVGNIDWNAAMWGNPASTPVPGNDYVTATGVQDERFRISADGASSVFGGDSITVNAGSRALIKLQNGSTATINGDLILNGGRLSYGPNGGPHSGILDVTNLIVSGTGSFIDPSSGVNTLTIDGALSGSGDLLLTPENGTNTKTVVFTEVGDYTGTLTVASTIRLDFEADVAFGGSLALEGTAILVVDQNLTFEAGSLSADGVFIQPGTYSGDSLFELGANFEEFGGTLTVNGSFPDADSDGLPDFYEDLIIAADLNDAVDGYEDIAGPNDAPTTTDFDGDGLSDTAEYANGVIENQTDPTNPDSDADGLRDGPELAGTTNGGVSTGFGPTDPNNPDSDSDSYNDFDETLYGSNPNDVTSLPGSALGLVNGSFEDPVLAVFGEGLSIASGTVPGWEAVENDFYVIDLLPANANDPSDPSEGFQWATAVRTAPEPDVDTSAYVGGANASMSMRQNVDVSSFATQIDQGNQTVLVDFDWRDNDSADQGIVTVQFLDGSGADLGRSSSFTTSGALQAWTTSRITAFPPAGTRTVRILAEAIKIGTGTSTVRNVHYDNFIARIGDFDSDNDNIPDPWELIYGLDPTDPNDATISSDGDTLTNLEEFNLGTNPTLADTDQDGVNDDDEVTNGTDPLDPTSPGSDPQVEDITVVRDGSGNITEVQVTFSGLIVGQPYTLVRGTDLQSFPDTVDTYQPVSTTDVFYDLTPLPSGTSDRAFYRLEN